MGHNYKPAYYSSVQDSITSLCKNILPFSFKKRTLLPASERKLSKQQSDNLKWQQDCFHKILNLMGLEKEGIVSEGEVSAFRTHLLETLIVSRSNHEQPTILRDKLLFLQELLHEKCISSEEYHASKRPLLQRLALQGAEINAKDLIVGAASKESCSDEEWSVIDLRDEQCSKIKENPHSRSKTKQVSEALKQIKGAVSVLGIKSSSKHGKSREERSIFELPGTNHQHPVNANISIDGVNRCSGENPFWNCKLNEKQAEETSVLMSESAAPPPLGSNGKVKKKAISSLFSQKERDGNLDSHKNLWGFDGLKKWKGSGNGEEVLVESTNRIWDGPDTKQIKRKLHPDGSASDFYIDKVLGEKIKTELTRIQSELSSSSPNLQFSNDQLEAISTRLPVDKADLKKFFPKSWCDRYGDVVLDVVKKEFKEHVGEMGNKRNTKQENSFPESRNWSTYGDDENHHP